MKDKHFYTILIVIVLLGIIGVGSLIGFTYKLKQEASVITVISGERW